MMVVAETNLYGHRSDDNMVLWALAMADTLIAKEAATSEGNTVVPGDLADLLDNLADAFGGGAGEHINDAVADLVGWWCPAPPDEVGEMDTSDDVEEA